LDKSEYHTNDFVSISGVLYPDDISREI